MFTDIEDIRRALEREELVPAFQPLVELRSGLLVGFEVLARWQHPTEGPILPPNFIPLAEQEGLIDQLMQQVFRKAFLSLKALPNRIRLSVNISPIQLRDRNLPHKLRVLAEQAGTSLERITVEITESALLADLECAKEIAQELKESGCRLSLDDFGTGYSSLAHLQALPFDELKIDRSYVKSMVNTRESRKIVAGVISLGHSLGLQTVAEGIETEEHADMLLWLGCELGQGWHYGKAMPESELPAALIAPPRPTITALSAPGDRWAVSSLEALPTQRLAQLQAIYDGSPVGLCFIDRNLRYVSLNSRLATMHDAPVSAHIGRTVQEVVPALYPTLEPFLLRALQGEVIPKVEAVKPASAPGETEKSLLFSYQPAWDEAYEVIGVSVAIVDVSDDKLPNDRDDVDNLTSRRPHTSHRVPWIMDTKGNSLTVSSHWVQTAEPVIERARNLGWLEALHPDDLERTTSTMRELLMTGQEIDIEYRVKDIDGQWRWMRSCGKPRFGATGEIIRWYGTVEDIDDQKQLATALESVASLPSEEGAHADHEIATP